LEEIDGKKQSLTNNFIISQNKQQNQYLRKDFLFAFTWLIKNATASER